MPYIKAMRFGLSGPRLFGGFARPEISFGEADFRRRQRASREVTLGGYCYVIKGEHGYCKISSSLTPVRRVSELQTGSRYALQIVSAVPVSHDAEEIEETAQDLLDDYRMMGVWFAVTPEMATAAIYAAADRVGRPIGHAALPQTPLISRLGWIIIIFIFIALWIIGQFPLF